MKHHFPLMRILFLLCLLSSMLVLSPVDPAYAGTITVTNTANSGPGSLRDAIANALPNDTINFSASLAGNTIHLGSQLVIDKTLTIDGAGLSPQIIISGDTNSDGTGEVGVFYAATLGVNINLSNVTVSKGSANSGGGLYYYYGTATITNCTFSDNTATTQGGGIYNNGTTIIINSTFSGNTAGNSGGGIFSYGPLTIHGSTFSGNTASNSGGGIMNGGTLTIANSTFSNNSASSAGGGLYNSGGPVNITNSTFSANSAGASFGGGLYNSGSATLRNTIIANSISGGNCNGVITNGGGNLTWGDTTCPGINADPILSALGNYGGPTQTFALLSGSAAIDTGNNAICAAVVGNPNYGAGGLDQRGITRPQGANCDIGAFEAAFVPALITPLNGEALLTNRPTFDWANFAGAIGYNIQIAKNNTFTQLVSNTNITGAGNSTYTPTLSLPVNLTLYWRVRAKLTATTYSDWSEIRSFTTANPPPAPTLTAPAANVLVTTATVLLNWNDVSMPAGTIFQKYEVQTATDSTFTTNATLANAAISEYTTPALTPNTKYYWRVRAYNTLGQYGIWSASRYFRAALSVPNSLRPGFVTPGPEEQLETRRPTFNWDTVTGAATYTVEVSTSSAFSLKAINATTAFNGYTHTAELAANTSYFWRVKANGTNGPSLYSQVRMFRTANPPSVPTLSAPANNALVTTITPLLDWNNSTVPVGTTFRDYEVQLSRFSDFTPWWKGSSTDSSCVTRSLSNATTYYWRVRAINTGADGIGFTGDDQFSGWSLVRSFRVPFAEPTLILPAHLSGVGSLKPTFTWNPIALATSYNIQISKVITFSPTAVNTTAINPTYTPLLNLTAGTVYYWRVRANGAYGPGLWSATFQFTTP